MSPPDSFSYDLKCPACGKEGTVQLSQAGGHAFLRDRSTSVTHLPDGFRFIRVDGPFDLEFYCVDCNLKVPD